VGRVLTAIWPKLDFTGMKLHGLPRRAHKLHPFTKHWLAWGWNQVAFISRRGWLIRTIQVLPHARVQSIRLSEGPVQRRLDLVEFHLHVSNGSVQVRCHDLDRRIAFQLLDGELARAAEARRAETKIDTGTTTGSVSL
jgi:putative membrane protein